MIRRLFPYAIRNPYAKGLALLDKAKPAMKCLPPSQPETPISDADLIDAMGRTDREQAAREAFQDEG